jgi:hypothetical protein
LFPPSLSSHPSSSLHWQHCFTRSILP